MPTISMVFSIELPATLCFDYPGPEALGFEGCGLLADFFALAYRILSSCTMGGMCLGFRVGGGGGGVWGIMGLWGIDYALLLYLYILN